MVGSMSIFRRKHRPVSTENAPVNFYEEAESNPELIAAEEEVNRQPRFTELINPVEDENLLE